MTTPHLAADIEKEEAREHEAYPDPLSALARACTSHHLPLRDYRKVPGWAALDGKPWTIGIGHTGSEVHQGVVWTDAQIDAQLANDIAHVETQLDAGLAWWRTLTDVREDVLVQMGFQMGVPGLLAFKTTLGHVKAGAYAAAADGMLASKWAKQTPARAKRLADRMRTGKR